MAPGIITFGVLNVTRCESTREGIASTSGKPGQVTETEEIDRAGIEPVMRLRGARAITHALKQTFLSFSYILPRNSPMSNLPKQKVSRPPPSGGKGKPLRGFPKDSPEVRLSKTLSWLLRHGAKSEGLFMRSDGYVRVNDIVCSHSGSSRLRLR